MHKLDSNGRIWGGGMRGDGVPFNFPPTLERMPVWIIHKETNGSFFTEIYKWMWFVIFINSSYTSNFFQLNHWLTLDVFTILAPRRWREGISKKTDTPQGRPKINEIRFPMSREVKEIFLRFVRIVMRTRTLDSANRKCCRQSSYTFGVCGQADIWDRDTQPFIIVTKLFIICPHK